MSNLIHFFYKLPIPASGLDEPNRVILSGLPMNATPNPETDPFGFETTFRLDTRSRDLIGKEIVTVPFIDFVEDAIEVPIDKPPVVKPEPVPKPLPVPEVGQLQFDFDAPQRLNFKRTVITVNGAKTKGYTVEGLDNSIFRGLRVAVVKCRFGRSEWYAHEATTGLSVMPRSWAGSYSNKTREGIIQIVSNHLKNAPQALWDSVEEKLDYNLES